MTEIHPYDQQTLNQILTESAAVEAAVREAVRDALLMHKRLGNPVATWQDGKVVWIPPDQIPIDDAPAPH
ncbi:MAG TPA: hypothetical protein VG826_15070 [Pirellulales bacterium]|nr:hypothetical protein [Pirellulales bacterium]